MSVVCCQVEFSATNQSLVQRSSTKCGVSECDRESSLMSRPWPTGGGGGMVKKKANSRVYSASDGYKFPAPRQLLTWLPLERATVWPAATTGAQSLKTDS